MSLHKKNLTLPKAAILPSWLFYQLKPQQQQAPGALLDVTAVRSHQDAWQSALPPSAAQRKKSIVITQVFKKDYLTAIQLTAMLEWLCLHGFVLYLCVNKEGKKHFIKIEGTLNDEAMDAFNDLANFDESKDYALLAEQYPFVQDYLVVLDAQKSAALRVSLDGKYFSIFHPSKQKDLEQQYLRLLEQKLNAYFQPTVPFALGDQYVADEYNTPVANRVIRLDQDSFSLTTLLFLQDCSDYPEVMKRIYREYKEQLNIEMRIVSQIIYFKNCPELAREMLRQCQEQDESLPEEVLKRCFKIYKDDLGMLWQLFESYKEVVEDDGAFCHSHYLKASSSYPELMQAVFSVCKDIIEEDDLADCLLACKDYSVIRKALLEQHTDKITVGNFYCCLAATADAIDIWMKILSQLAQMQNNACHIFAFLEQLEVFGAITVTEENEHLLESIYKEVVAQAHKTWGSIESLENLCHIKHPAFLRMMIHSSLVRWFKSEDLLQFLDYAICYIDFSEIIQEMTGIGLAIVDKEYAPCESKRVAYYPDGYAHYSGPKGQLVSELMWGNSANLPYRDKRELDKRDSDNAVIFLAASINDSRLIALIKMAVLKGELDHLAIVEIYPDASSSFSLVSPPADEKKNIQDLIDAFSTCRLPIKQLVVPEILRGHLDFKNFRHQFSQPFFQVSGLSVPNPVAQAAGSRQDKIYIAQNAASHTVSTQSPEQVAQTYDMREAGKVLNDVDARHIKIRTGRIELAPNSLEGTIYVPRSYQRINPPLLTAADIKRFKLALPQANAYCLFLNSLTSGERIRLHSLDAQERFMGVCAPMPEALSIEQGDDGFYYAISTEDCAFSYVLCQPLFKLCNIFSDKKIVDVLEQYQKNQKTSQALFPQLIGRRYAEWFQAVYQSGKGTCAQRVAAVWHVMLAEGVDPRLVKMIYINNNHVVLELQDINGDWLQRDLGGVAADCIYASETKLFQASAVKPVRTTGAAVYASAFMSAIAVASVARGASAFTPVIAAVPAASAAVHLEAPLLASVAAVAPKPQVVTAQQRLLIAMRKIMTNYYQPKLIHSPKELTEDAFRAAEDKVNNHLLITDEHQVDVLANHLLKTARDEGRMLFYLSGLTDVDINELAIRIHSETRTQLTRAGLLEAFLINAKSEHRLRPILLVNCAAITDQTRLQFNTLIDTRARSIHGVAIDDSIIVMVLDTQLPSDTALMSRYTALLDCRKVEIKSNVAAAASCASTSFVAESAVQHSPLLIDIQGYSNWQAKLFGRVVLNADQKLSWQPTTFVHALQSAAENKQPLLIEIINCDEQAKILLQKQIARARAEGHFLYHGYSISLSECVTVVCGANRFDFSSILPVAVQNNVTNDSVPFSAKVLNKNLFDFLLKQKKIDNQLGAYAEVDGWIAAAKDGVLHLFVTHELSETQWYCLFHEAKQNNVALQLYLAPQVALPQGLICKVLPAHPVIVLNKPKIWVSNNPQAVLNKLKENDPDLKWVFDVQDLSYSDLVENCDYQPDELIGFRNFKVLVSDVLQSLSAGKKVVLKGKYSDALLRSLHPLLCGRPMYLSDGTVMDVAQQIIFIIEEESIQVQTKSFEPLMFLKADEDYIVQYEVPSEKIAATQFNESAPSCMITDNSKKEAELFIKMRKTMLVELLSITRLLKIFGATSVGKSSLLKIMDQEEKSYCTVYRECAQIPAWANDKSEKIKILVIEDFDTEDNNFMVFEPLKTGNSGAILYKGVCYELSRKNVVVFICGPHSYGGRLENQKLFDHEVPVWLLKDFSYDYMYECLLKPIFLQAKDLLNEALTESIFKLRCQEFLDTYRTANAKQESTVTIHELQQWVLDYCFAEQKIKMEEDAAPLEATPFVPTPATEAVRAKIKQFIALHKAQHQQKFPGAGLAVNGIFIEGLAGFGKTIVLPYLLAEAGYKLLDSKQPIIPGILGYFKIAAGLPIAEKKHLLLQAFDCGLPVIIDELDSCIDELAKFLKFILCGAHPDTGRPAAVSGFMLFATGNGSHLKGRRLIGDDQRHRLITLSFDPFTVDDILLIADILFPSIHPRTRKIFSECFVILMQENPGCFNLRSLDNHKAAFLALLNDPEICPDIGLSAATHSTVFAAAAVCEVSAENYLNQVYSCP